MDLIIEKVSKRVNELEAELKRLAFNTCQRIKEYSEAAGTVHTTAANAEQHKINLLTLRLSAIAAAHEKDYFVRDCECFLERFAVLVSAEWKCWKRSLRLKAYAKENGWVMEDGEYLVVTVWRKETSGDLMGFYGRLERVIKENEVDLQFAMGVYDYEWEPVTKFTTHRWNLCDSQTHLSRNGKKMERIAYKGIGTRGLRRGQIVTTRWTMLKEGDKVAYIETDPETGNDGVLVVTTVDEFQDKFVGWEAADANGYEWGKDW